MAIILFFISVIRWEYPPPNIESQIKLRYPQSVILDGIKCDGFPYLFVFVKSLAPQNALPATGKMKILIFQKTGSF